MEFKLEQLRAHAQLARTAVVVVVAVVAVVAVVVAEIFISRGGNDKPSTLGAGVSGGQEVDGGDEGDCSRAFLFNPGFVRK